MFRKYVQNAVLLLGSLLFVLLMGEVVCRVFFPDKKLRYTVDQELLSALKPNQVGFLGSGKDPIRINELGFRGPGLAELSQRRILFLGNSFTFGSGVGESDTFVARVDESLGVEISVVNGGQPGYGIYQMEILLERVAPVVRPEIVVLTVWEGLIARQPPTAERRKGYLQKSARIKRLKSLSLLGTHLYRQFEQVALRFGADDLVVTLGAHENGNSSSLQRYLRALEADQERLTRIRDYTEAHGAKLLLVLWPREGFVSSPIPGLSEEITMQLRSFSEDRGIHFVTVQPALESFRPNVLLIPDDWHPTPLAHCLAAREIVFELEKLEYSMSSLPGC